MQSDEMAMEILKAMINGGKFNTDTYSTNEAYVEAVCEAFKKLHQTIRTSFT